MAQLIIEQKELADIRAKKEKEMRLKQNEEVDAAYPMGNTWGAHNEGREDQTKRMISKLLHERRDEAMEKIRIRRSLVCKLLPIS